MTPALWAIAAILALVAVVIFCSDEIRIEVGKRHRHRRRMVRGRRVVARRRVNPRLRRRDVSFDAFMKSLLLPPPEDKDKPNGDSKEQGNA